jgi:hypothetical protein
MANRQCFDRVPFATNSIFCDVEGTRSLYRELEPIDVEASQIYDNFTRQRPDVLGETTRALLDPFGVDHNRELNFGYFGRNADVRFPDLHLYCLDFSFIGTWPPMVAVTGGRQRPEFLLGPEATITPQMKAVLASSFGGEPPAFKPYPLLTIQLWFFIPWVLDPAILDELGI